VSQEVPVPISPAEIPQDVLEEVCEKLWTYTVPVFAIDGAKPSYRGTATCVTGSGKHYLLTAAHVWRELRGDRFALALEAEHPLIPIYKDLVEPTVFEPTGQPEWGPDLALIKLPDIDSANIRRVKAFYNLDKRKPESDKPVGYDKGLWGVIGVPAELSTFGEDEAELKIRLFASVVESAHKRGDFDYVDLGFYHQGRSDLPHSYGGLSGSGLWQAPITKSDSGVVSWNGEARLEGVAFYQKFSNENEGVIRCHGRTSIYEGALRCTDQPRD
jgi:hypothetical protein